MLQIVDISIGFFTVLACLFSIGITRGRWVSQKIWVILWSIASLVFALFLIASYIMGETVFLGYALGGSLGYVTAVLVHTIHHAIEETRKG